MIDWVANTVASLVQWVYWIGRENGPAVGRRSRRTWRGLALLGRVQLWIALTVVAALVLTWTYAT
jgi:hypothetical protein